MPRINDDGGDGGGVVWRVPGIYAAMREREREHYYRYGAVIRVDGDGREVRGVWVDADDHSQGCFVAPRQLLDAFDEGASVTVPAWRVGGHGVPRVPIPRELRCWPNRFVVSPEDTVRPAPEGPNGH